ncbi:MAG TPA: polyribonucleotide nucleotidyltransferase [Dysgonamonadaceae bacterium]|nr:polyribonucleotide nucleotidyltransferase [Dysgonamonadaceae bacterium]
MINPIVKSISLADGRTITLETGKLAKQADGAVTLRMGNTMLLATVCAAKDASPGVDFMPLQVEYREKFSSFGRYPGGFMKREGRPSEHEILTSRLIDRTLRPLFPENYHAEVFVNVTLYSSDGEDMPDALAGLAASAALAVSDIPFNGPMSEARVSRVNGKFILNPTFSQNEEADMDIIVGATLDNIMMVEGEMDEVSEEEFLGAIKIAHEAIKTQCQAQIDLMEACGTVKKREYHHEDEDEELRKDIWDKCYQKAYEVAVSQNPNKHARMNAFQAIHTEYLESITDEDERLKKAPLVTKYYHAVEKEAMRRSILDEGKRLDGRATTQIRPIWIEVDCLPGPHGSAIFTRGETQSLTTVTLGTKLDEKIIDDVLNRGKDRFLLHYNFPPFSTGDARPQRGTGRREIGHGNLAHRALNGVIPDDYPYVIRIVSDILESNGSSSMATVCAATLALMDAGVQIKKPVTGIAMGLISENNGEKFAILSDILGDEDHLGDMDFKVCGTKDGITAAQMDIKVDGLSYEVLEKALSQAREGRLHIMDHVLDAIPEPRADLKPHAPRIETLDIPKDLIGAVIGPGGKIIQGIQEETGAIITIEEVDGHGHIQVSGSNKDMIDAAMLKIRGIVAIPMVDEEYEATVRSVMPYGLFCEFLPGKDGLLHISEIDWKRIENIEDAGYREGDKITVKLVDIDPRSGKFKLSRKALLERPERSH